jgi:hypothetical protein
MGLDTNFNQDPYYDDFDEAKNFHRVLFKPAVAVQARELTQLQTILQNQIERFGDNILKEGTIVKGCGFTYNDKLAYVKILDLQTDGQPVVMSNYRFAKAVGESSGVEAAIVQVSTGLQSQSPVLNTLHLKYTKSSGANKKFTTTENIRIENFTTGEIITTVTAAGTVEGASTVGFGTALRVSDGIIYQKGHFIRVDDQLAIVSRYSRLPTNIAVGYTTTESIINSNNDTSLLDNAQGYNNQNAPGADRLKLTATLTVKSVEQAVADEKFFTLVEYSNGRPVRRKETTQYSFIGDEMSRRTLEESGNYSINQFPLSIKAGANSDYIVARVGPGLSYIDGYRIENHGSIDVRVNASTDTNSIEGQFVTATLGHYINIDELQGNFQYNDISTIYLYDTAQNSRTANQAFAVANAAGEQIGTAKIRGLTYNTGTVGTFDCQYKAYIFDIRIANNQHSFANTKSIIYDETGTGGSYGSADIVLNSANKASIQDFSLKKTFFPIGKGAIKTITSSTADFTYTTSQTMSLSSGSGNISAPSGSTFPYADIALTNTIKREDLIVIDSDGLPVNLNSATVTISGSGATMTFSSVGAVDPDGQVTVYHKAKRSPAVALTKEPRTVYVKIDPATNPGSTTGEYSLGLPDVYEIVDVYRSTDGTYSSNTESANTDSVGTLFSLYPNQRDAYYGISYVRKKRTLTISGSDKLLFEVKVFDRTGSSGAGYSSVDSYVTLPTNPVNYEDIPVYKSEGGTLYDLRNVLDFRPYAANTVVYATTIATANVANVSVSADVTFTGEQYNIFPNSNSEIDFDYYLSRQDRLLVDGEGNFKVIQGQPAEKATVPPPPSRGMTLATIFVPPFPSLTSKDANAAGKPEHAVLMTTETIRGYTMKDIGKLDKRIKQLEYYVVLNALETSAKDKTITDGAGNNRFKNGIFTDSFEDLSIADTKSIEFSSSIDQSAKELQPKILEFNIDLKATTLSGATDFGPAITLNKTDASLISQPYASQARNPVADLYSFEGTMNIHPEYDPGYDEVKGPDINLNIDTASGLIEYNDKLSQFVNLKEVSQQTIGTTTSTSSREVNRFTDSVGTYATIETKTTTEKTIEKTVKQLQVSSETTKEKVGDFVTDVRIQPYMKSRVIRILATGLRPETQVYFFFDKINVSAHVAPAVSADLDDENNLRELRRSKPFGSAITVDSAGVVRAVFKIPPETFYTGDRVLEILDVNQYNQKFDSITQAAATFAAYNYSVEKSSEYMTTRKPMVDVTSDSTTFIERNTNVSTRNDLIQRTYSSANSSDYDHNGYDNDGFDAFGVSPSFDGSLDGGGGGAGDAGGSVICTTLMRMGYLPDYIWQADELFGEHLRQNDPYVFEGYLKWAKIVVAWMNGQGPDVMTWIKDPEERARRQSAWATRWTVGIGTPWAIEMAHRLGYSDKGSLAGRIVMAIGLPISRYIGKVDKPAKKRHIYMLIAMLGVARFITLFSKTKVDNVKATNKSFV